MERSLDVNFGYKTPWDLEQLKPNDFFPVPACVVFAERVGENAEGAPLTGVVERWTGKTDGLAVERMEADIVDTSVVGDSRYAVHSRQGPTIVPRCLFFVQETTSTAVIQAGQTVTVNPRRGSQDKKPWKELALTELAEQTVEASHLYQVHLGETVVPYATLEPLKAVLPMKHGEHEIQMDPDGPGGLSMGSLDQRMRRRWRIISDLWDAEKQPANKLNLIGRLDYHRDLSEQLSWFKNPGARPVRIVYTQNGVPTASLVDNGSIIDTKLYWVTCRNLHEAYYLLAIINSEALYDAAAPMMSKGQFGARDLHKHLWKLPIPEFDAANTLHARVSDAGAQAAAATAERLKQLRAERGDKLTVTIARRELRKWLRNSPEGTAVEAAVQELLA